MEGGEAPGAILGLPVGQREARLAHRVLHHRQVSLTCADPDAGAVPGSVNGVCIRFDVFTTTSLVQSKESEVSL